MNVLRILIASAVLAAPSAASAQQVKLQLEHGRVSLEVKSVSIVQILNEWARVGGVKIVNGEKVQGPPVTLQLTNVPEREALDLLLRGAAGYMLGLRAPGTAGASAYDRILILATSNAPRNPPPAAGLQAPRPVPMQAENGPDAFPEPTVPGGNVRRFAPPVIRPPMPGGSTGQGEVPPDGATPPPPSNAPTAPGNPFGVPTGSGLPGAIAPAPSPQAPAGR